jgi:tetratricopeptide (TPR) repeat protein
VRTAAAFLVLAVTLPAWWRETNSHASSARGSRAYAQQQYGAAASAFRQAQEASPSSRAAFNLGTAEIAAGDREQGSTRLADAIGDPQLRADALFNRGNSALASKALDHAIRDYSDALRANPKHAAAKRNLEIALQRRQNEQQSRGGDKQDPKGQGQQPKPQPQQPGRHQPQKGPVDLDALLRSVQQQEQEELRRMKGQAAEGRVGW